MPNSNYQVTIPIFSPALQHVWVTIKDQSLNFIFLTAPTFTLLDSLTALELMEPKLDRPIPSPIPLKDFIASGDLPLQLEWQSLVCVRIGCASQMLMGG